MAQILLRLAMFFRIGTRFRPLHAKKAIVGIPDFVHRYHSICLPVFKDTGENIQGYWQQHFSYVKGRNRGV